MMENILRDEETMPIITHMLRGYRDYMTTAAQTLIAGRGARGHARRRVSAAIGHALAFTTWRSLTCDNELTDFEAAGLMHRLAATATRSDNR